MIAPGYTRKDPALKPGAASTQYRYPAKADINIEARELLLGRLRKAIR
jgi:hypothetical protein